jgi:hypothetical protein
MTFTQAGVVLGRGTLLAEFEKKGLAPHGLAFNGEEARVLSLLSAAYGFILILLFYIMMELAWRSYPWKAGITLGYGLCISYLFQIVIS